MATLGTPTNLTSGGNSGATSSNTTASISPSAYSLILASVSIVRGGTVPSTIAISTTLSGLSFTKVETALTGIRTALFYAVCGATPGTGTITFTYSGGSGDPSRQAWIVDQILVADRTTPVSESAVNTGTGSTLTVTLGGIAAGNKAYGVVGSSTATDITPGTNETQLTEVGSGGTNPVRLQSEYGTETTVDWSTLGTTGVGSAGVAIEINVAAPITVSVSDTQSSSDAELADISAEVSDTTTETDTVKASLGLRVSDILGMTDAQDYSIDLITSDSTVVTDEITVTIPGAGQTISVSDSPTVSDTITTSITPYDDMIHVLVNGVDKSPSIVFNSLKKTDNLNQKTDKCEFTVRKYGTHTYVPTIGDEIHVLRRGKILFGGVIMRISEKTKASQVVEYSVTCNDFSQYLKRKLVTERYTNTTLFAIIEDIIDTYAPDFTYNNISGDLPIESFAFNRIGVDKCIQKLADALSYVWYVDYEKNIHFFPKNTESAPIAITDTSGTYIYNSLEIIEDISQLRNAVLVQGGDAVSATTRTEYFTSDGLTAEIPLANKFSSLPTVIVGGTTQTVGTEYLSDDASFDCMWNFNEKYIRFTEGNIPSTDTAWNVTGYYLYPIVVNVPAYDSIAEYGRYEFAIKDATIKSTDEAINRAIAELDSYKNELYEGGFRTYEDGLRAGQVVNINSVQRGKNIDVLIQSVKSAMRDPEGNSLQYDVKFATLKSLGIIEFLQAQLLDDEIIEGDDETLLSYIQISPDSCALIDSIDEPTFTTGPYKWSGVGDTASNRLIWGYGVWQ